MLFGKRGHLVLRLYIAERTEFAGVDQQAVLGGIRQHRLILTCCRVFGAAREDDDANLQPVFFCEFIVSLVVGGHGHDGSGAVVEQDVVGNPDRQPLVVERIDGKVAGEDTMLLDCADVAGFPPRRRRPVRGGPGFTRLFLLLEQTGDLIGQLRTRGGELLYQWMLGRKLDAGRTKDGIDARGEHCDFLVQRGRIFNRGQHRGSSVTPRMLVGAARVFHGELRLPRLRCVRSSCAAWCGLSRASHPACSDRRAIPGRNW